MDSTTQYPLAKHFEAIAAKLKSYGTSLNLKNEQLLNLYSLYKQANEGDNTTAQPSFYQLEAKAKWNAWNTQKGKSKEQAKQGYVEYALTLIPEDAKAEFTA